jgi:hypothetical protein
MAPYRSAEAHIVLGGAPRSGTTILRKLLDLHPDVRAGPETKLLVPAAFDLGWLAQAYGLPRVELEAMRSGSSSQGAFIDAFATRVRSLAGKDRWAEKTPQNIRHLDWIMGRFPESSVVHVIRDGRDVVCSMRQHPDWRWVDGAWRKELVARPLDWYARRWLADTAAGLARRGDTRYVEVRYEELVVDPGTVLSVLCDALALVAHPGWLETALGGRAIDRDGALPEAGGEHRPDYDGALSDASVGRWRTDLGPDEQRQVMGICGARLRELGYED